MLDIVLKDTPVIDLGNLDQKKCFLEDDIIPLIKRNNFDLSSNGYWLKIDSEYYYFKIYNGSSSLLRELMGEKVSNYFGFSSVHYNLAKGYTLNHGQKKEYYGLLSKWARKKECIYFGINEWKEEIAYFYNLNQSLGIFDFFQEVFPNEPINNSFRKFIVRELFTNEWDRLENEIVIEHTHNSYDLAYLSDYEMEFDRKKKRILYLPFYYYIDLNNEETIKKLKNDEVFMKYLKMAMEIPLKEMYQELIKERNIRFLPYDEQEFFCYEKETKEFIRSRI